MMLKQISKYLGFRASNPDALREIVFIVSLSLAVNGSVATKLAHVRSIDK